MVEKIGHIKNPLTVISIFAGIAEISGTSVLPFITENNQSLYVWFLMFFPIFLVGIFFITLNFNHKVLYAPSDYKNEQNFIDLYRKININEQARKLSDEVEELIIEESNEDSEINHTTPSPSNDHSKKNLNNESQINTIKSHHPLSNRQLMGDVMLAENLFINKIASDCNIEFNSNVKLTIPNNNINAYFDAVGMNQNEIHAIEVKLFRSKNSTAARFIKSLENAEILKQHYSGFDSKEFILHLCAVIDSDYIDKNNLLDRLNGFSKKYNVKTKIHISTLDDLQNEYQYGFLTKT